MKKSKELKASIFLILSTLILFGYIVTKENNNRYEYPTITAEVDYDIMLPSYVPDGYSVTDMSISPLFNTIEYTYDENILYYTQGHNDATVSLDNEHNTISEYQSEEYKGYLLTNTRVSNNYLLFVWDDEFFYEISGTIDKNEIIKMIESIKLYYSSTE